MRQTPEGRGPVRTSPIRPAHELERVKGIEPSFSAWEADVLPLNDTRILMFKRFRISLCTLCALAGFRCQLDQQTANRAFRGILQHLRKYFDLTMNY